MAEKALYCYQRLKERVNIAEVSIHHAQEGTDNPKLIGNYILVALDETQRLQKKDILNAKMYKR